MAAEPHLLLNVNDDAATRYLTTRVLERAGFRVREAASGAEALAAVSPDTDLVILDVRLPDVSGFEVCRRIKADPRTRHVLVLHLSALHVDARDRVHALAEAGADGYLFAPVEHEELVAQVHALLRLARAERAVRRLSAEVERRQRLLDTALAASSDPFLLFDADGRVVYANAAVLSALGLGGGALLGRSVHQPPLGGALAQLVAQALEGREVRGELELGPGRRPFEFVFTPALGTTGGVEVVVGSGRDVREQRGREEFREQFIAMLGHDLRNPLQAVSMSAQQLRRHAVPADGPAHALAGRILTSVGRMDRMIRQLLDYARSRLGGGMPVERGACDLGEVVRAGVDELRASAPEREVLLELGEGLGGEWDADRLAQVVSNLVGNALVHGDAKAPVSVRAWAERDAVWLAVHNAGAPIPPELLPHVFEPYRRSGRAGSPGGLGIGLYISHEVVRAHGGELSVSSTAEQGTTFRVRLPRAATVGQQATGS